MCKKRIYAKIVYDRISKEQISAEDRKRPEVSESINKNGYYDKSDEIAAVRRNCLDYLVSLGYVKKKEDTLYRISYMYVLHPYHPFVLPFSGVVITNVTNSQTENMILNSDEYSIFRQSANMFKNQMAAGNHLHISSFDYSDFSYASDVYEVEDKYFDAIFLDYDGPSDRLTVSLVEPFVYSSSINNKSKKNWRTIREINQSKFLEGAGCIDSEVESLPWKAKYDGIITYKKEAYYLHPKQGTRENERNQAGFLEMPDFLNVKRYSYGNWVSRIFEEAVKNYFTTTLQYNNVTTRYKPPYLEKKELDVFAEKGDRTRKYITVCECKFRLPNSRYSVTTEDLSDFRIKKEKVEQNEKKVYSDVIFKFWLITNGGILDEGLMEQAKSAGIEIMKATLTKGWEDRADWKVTEIKAKKDWITLSSNNMSNNEEKKSETKTERLR